MKKILFLFFVFLVVSSISTYAGNGTNDSALHTKVAQWLNNNNGIRFLENKGQLMDMQRKPVPNVLYEASGGGMDVYVTTSGLSYVFVKLEKHKKKNSTRINFKHINDSITETWCRADMQFVGASIKKENIIQEGESTDRSDYYYGDICPNGILGVHSYTKVTVKNIYPGIDWVLHSGKKGLKYDFVVHPGADPSLIKLKYKWTNKPQLQEDGSVKITTPMGNITEGIPVSYSNDEKVQTTYNVQDSEVHFKVGEYNSTQTLIIDPILKWATYYAGDCDEDVWDMQDDGTNVWLTGDIEINNFPTLNPGGGAYFQGTSASTSYTAFILKFNMAGVLKWATYYGGRDGDGGSSIYSDGTNVWVTGYTDTTLPTYNPGGGAYFQATGAGIFILKFSVNGVREWATYYGSGSGAQFGFSIQSDGTNVWLTGRAYPGVLPTFNPGNGAYFQGTLTSKNYTAFILKFSTAGILKWATYYSGSGYEYGNSIQSDGAHVWVTGYTTSSDFPTFNPGGGAYFQNTLASASSNAFILQFDTGGVRKWATYYGGSSATLGDEGNSIYSDGRNAWVTGYTSSTDFPTMNPGGGTYFQGTLASSRENAFILQFNTGGVRKWATYYGGTSKFGEIGYSIQSDGNNVWVCGATGSIDFPLLNPGWGFFQDSLGTITLPNQDVFILQFNTAGIRKWATYYGNDWEDDGSYIWSDGTNLFVAGDATGFSTYPTLNPGSGAYYLDSLHGKGTENAFIGKFKITCLPHVNVSSSSAICAGNSTMLTANGASTYSWTPPTGLSASNIANPVASPTLTTTYTLISDSSGCTDTSTVTVRVKESPTINACCDHIIFAGDDTIMVAHSPGAKKYEWTPQVTCLNPSCDSVQVSPTVTTTYTVTSTDSAGCQVERIITIVVDMPCSDFVVPNVFTPGYPGLLGLNDVFYINATNVNDWSITVYDRWGKEMFHTTNPTQYWDGNTESGGKAPDGVYYYIIHASCGSTSFKKDGYLQLIR